MALSFLYLAVRALLGALVRSRRGLHVKDVELLVLRQELEILRRPARAAATPTVGRLKPHYGLAMLRVRGIERVRLHADLIMPARSSLALSRARAAPLAA